MDGVEFFKQEVRRGRRTGLDFFEQKETKVTKEEVVF